MKSKIKYLPLLCMLSIASCSPNTDAPTQSKDNLSANPTSTVDSPTRSSINDLVGECMEYWRIHCNKVTTPEEKAKAYASLLAQNYGDESVPIFRVSTAAFDQMGTYGSVLLKSLLNEPLDEGEQRSLSIARQLLYADNRAVATLLEDIGQRKPDIRISNYLSN